MTAILYGKSNITEDSTKIQETITIIKNFCHFGMDKTCTVSIQTKSEQWVGKWTQSPTPTKKVSAVDSCWGRANLTSPREWSWTTNHTPGQTPRPGVVRQHKTDSMFSCVHFLLCVVLVFFSLYLFLLIYFWEQKKVKLGK